MNKLNTSESCMSTPLFLNSLEHNKDGKDTKDICEICAIRVRNNNIPLRSD